MKKTPQEFKREKLKELLEKTLKSQSLKLQPLDITVEESWKNDFTSISLAISETTGEAQRSIEITEKKAKGFVDGMFKACHSKYVEGSPSLRNLRLVDYQVNPSFKKSESDIGSDASTEVIITVDVTDRGRSEFSCTSRSILHSSLVATLNAFEFYINCDAAFEKLNLIIADAQTRNRSDIIEKCMLDLSRLTEVNSYEKKKS